MTRVKSPHPIPTIVTEDIDSDSGKVSTSNESTDADTDWNKNPSQPKTISTSGRSNGRSINRRHSASPPESNGNVSKSVNESSSTSTMNSSESGSHHSHYHTVHGIGNHSQHGSINPDGSSSPIYSLSSPFCNKQRTRSHSGPTYPIGFTQQIRHSALISAGMATSGATSRRRQSDDSEQTSSSLRSRVSPSGSSFFDSFR